MCLTHPAIILSPHYHPLVVRNQTPPSTPAAGIFTPAASCHRVDAYPSQRTIPDDRPTSLLAVNGAVVLPSVRSRVCCVIPCGVGVVLISAVVHAWIVELRSCGSRPSPFNRSMLSVSPIISHLPRPSTAVRRLLLPRPPTGISTFEIRSC